MKKLLIILLLLACVGGAVAWYVWQSAMSPNTVAVDKNYVLLTEGTTVDQLSDLLSTSGLLQDQASFKRTASWMEYSDDNVRYGRFAIPANYSNRDLINYLKSAKEAPVNVITNNVREITDLAGSVAAQIAIDSLTLLEAMLDTAVLHKYGLTPNTALTLYIPNTYQVYWSTTAEAFVERMAKEYDKWWSKDNRLAKAQALGLTRQEVYTLASIIDKESNLNAEKPRIAGVYLNRLSRGIALQADPTVVFATRIFDLKRVLNKHLTMDSPYNTYKYAGLPPGPIYMASIAGLEAVLNPEDHQYLYFCAAPGYGSQHLFATNLRQHNANARRFHKWLNQQGIK